MSANNQTLIKEHKGKYYVFHDIMAEAWDDVNILPKSQADAEYDTYEKAVLRAQEMEEERPTEYGIAKDYLIKDGNDVIVYDGNNLLD